jgi:tRNA (guanosine-2'-O-)-methyltransferase
MTKSVAGHRVLTYEMSASEQERVIACLSKFATDDRLAGFQTALANRTRDITLVLENVSNAHNAAAVMRSAEAFGLFELHIIPPEEGRFTVSRNVASGANKWLDLHWHDKTKACFSSLKARGYEIWASDLQDEAVPIEEIDVRKKIALVFGNEREGISDIARECADRRFVVPMQGFVESLNISVAAAVSCYHLSQKRTAQRCKTGLGDDDRRAILAAWLVQSIRASDEILRLEGLNIPVIGHHKVQFVE